MFLGTFTYALDEKGRLTLPAKFRHLLDRIVVTHGLDGCLFVFSDERWDRLAENLDKALPITQRGARSLNRFFYAGAADLSPDGQGRILIPSFLREYADLKDEVVIIGANNRLELWNPERWKAILHDAESNAEEIAEQYGNITI